MVRDRLAELQAKSAEAKAEAEKGKYSTEDTMDDPLSDSQSRISGLDEKLKRLQEDVVEFYKVQKNLVTRPHFDDKTFKNKVREMEELSDQIFTTSNDFQSKRS